jgi:hypothetical protein
MHRTARISVVVLFSSLVGIGCGQGAAVDTAAYSNRQIFEGVVFGAGPVANLIPEARDQLRPELYVRNAGELSAMADARSALVDEIERAQPNFLAEFAGAARSGNPARVRAMLSRAAEAVSQASAAQRAVRTPNLPIDTARTPNLPFDLVARTPNLPIDTARTPNLPIDTARTPNLPFDLVARTPNLPVDTARTPNLPIDTARTPNLPFDLVARTEPPR